jgi:ribosome-associated protein
VLVVDDRIRIPLREITFRYVRSSGPGGQNVNKVASKAELRWPVKETASLPDDVRHRFLSRFKNRVTNDGELLLTSDRHRDQERNREDCLERLRGMLAEVARPPKRRRKTRPSRTAVEKRIQSKKIRSGRKATRQKPARDD